MRCWDIYEEEFKGGVSRQKNIFTTFVLPTYSPCEIRTKLVNHYAMNINMKSPTPRISYKLTMLYIS